MAVEPVPDRRQRGMAEVALDEAPEARHMDEVLRLPVAHAEAREDAEDLGISSQGRLLGGYTKKAGKAKIIIMVSGKRPVSAPANAGRQRTGAISTCSLSASTLPSWCRR